MPLKTIHFILLLLLSSGLMAQELRTLNTSSPGQRFEVKDYLKRNKQNLVVFTSSKSEECENFLRTLKVLGRGNSGLAIGLVDIDRPKTLDVDWKSPLVRQYNLRELPYVLIFDESKEPQAQGHEARKLILEWLDQI